MPGRQLFSDIAVPSPGGVYIEANTGDYLSNYGVDPTFNSKVDFYATDNAPYTLNGTKPRHGGAGLIRTVSGAYLYPFQHSIWTEDYTLLSYFNAASPASGGALIGMIGSSESLYLEMQSNKTLRANLNTGSGVTPFHTFSNIPQYIDPSAKNLSMAAIGRDTTRGVTFAFCNGEYAEGPADPTDWNFASGEIWLSILFSGTINVQQQLWKGTALTEEQFNILYNNGHGTWIE